MSLFRGLFGKDAENSLLIDFAQLKPRPVGVLTSVGNVNTAVSSHSVDNISEFLPPPRRQVDDFAQNR